MGAEFTYETFDHVKTKEIKAAIKDLAEEDRYEHGAGGYSGTWQQTGGGVRFTDRVFDTEDRAVDWLERNTEKGCRAVAVNFRLPAKPTKAQEKKRERLYAKYQEAEKKHRESVEKLRKVFWGRKSKMVGCGDCGSRMSREHLKTRAYYDLRCPLCGSGLLSATDKKRIETSKARVAKARQAWEDASKTKATNKLGTVVGMLAAC